ncbi:MAG: hypothetical protein VB089_04470 [Anaerolineaceae bacterium]|jgi:hypothetical protein|nr:hypothetical protein [Anaerolineaceae bacterium]
MRTIKKWLRTQASGGAQAVIALAAGRSLKLKKSAESVKAGLWAH